MTNTGLARRTETLRELLSSYSQSDFANAAAGEHGEDLLNRLSTLLLDVEETLVGQPRDVRELLGAAAKDLRNLRAQAEHTEELFNERLGERKRPTWLAVNPLQDFVQFVRCWDIYERLLPQIDNALATDPGTEGNAQ